ncbi:MAG: NADH-quinone oxidoreductase subunit M [Bryobacteraceae bacterium]|nr:NADH-quinone oxidoreductase subunit M [Bryobacteraceae bacterium]
MLLNLVIFLPLVGFILLLLLPKDSHDGIKRAALVVSLVVFAASLLLIAPVQQAPAQLSEVTDVPWISYPPIRYHVGIDGLSLWLVILSTLLTPISILVSWSYIQKRVKEFFAFLLLLEFGLVGVFAALDFFLFYVFFEVTLVPMYFLIGIWGHDKRIYAAVKFFLYTLAGSVLMLAAIIYLFNKSGTFDYLAMLELLRTGKLALSHLEQTLLFLAFFVAFAIKVPLWPLHTWLPDAHGEAPTAGSVMLASVMLKMGTYGLVRFCLPMFPQAARENAPWIIVLAITGIIYGALVAMVQPNMKRLVAYSSVSHLGFVVLGIFSFNQAALDGAVYQMLNHGVSTGALFMLVGYLYERRHSLEIADYGGVATPAPKLAAVFAVTMLASVGLPTLNNFIGEYLILQGAALVDFKWAVFAAIGVILSAVYMLWMYQRTFFGEATDELKHHMPDMNTREWVAIVPLLVLMVWMGTYTQTFLPTISASNTKTLEQSKTNVEYQVRLNAR